MKPIQTLRVLTHVLSNHCVSKVAVKLAGRRASLRPRAVMRSDRMGFLWMSVLTLYFQDQQIIGSHLVSHGRAPLEIVNNRVRIPEVLGISRFGSSRKAPPSPSGWPGDGYRSRSARRLHQERRRHWQPGDRPNIISRVLGMMGSSRSTFLV